MTSSLQAPNGIRQNLSRSMHSLSYQFCLGHTHQQWWPSWHLIETFTDATTERISKTFKLSGKFWIRSWPLIFHICLSCIKAFLFKPNFFFCLVTLTVTFDTHFFFNLTFVITFDPLEIRTLKIHVCIPYDKVACQVFQPCDLDRDLWTTVTCQKYSW